jgi:hypothetical protein
MRKLTQPWQLRRSFGSQPVGNVDGPRWPEAGITTQEIPALPSWVTFREVQSSTADLPTRRPADLPTCRIWVLDFSDSSEVSPAFKSKAENFAASLSPRPRMPSQGPAIVRTSSPMLPSGAIFLKILFLIGNSEEPQFLCQGFRTETLSCSV